MYINIFSFCLTGYSEALRKHIKPAQKQPSGGVLWKSVLESLFNKVAGLQAFVKKRRQHRCFHENIAKFLRTSFFKEHLWWLLWPAFIKDMFPKFSNAKKEQYIIFKSKIKYAEEESNILKDDINNKKKLLTQSQIIKPSKHQHITPKPTPNNSNNYNDKTTKVNTNSRQRNTNHTDIGNDVKLSSRSHNSNVSSRSFVLNDSIKESIEETEKKDNKKAIIAGDSVTNHVIGLDISQENEIVKVRQCDAATRDDIIDEVKPTVLNKRDLIYSGTNGIQNQVPLKNQKLDNLGKR